MKHTPTPWQHAESSFGRGNHFFSIVDKNLKRIAEVEALTQTKAVADGLRIVSCVNALEGIENPEAIKEAIETLEALDKEFTKDDYLADGKLHNWIRQALANLKKGE